MIMLLLGKRLKKWYKHDYSHLGEVYPLNHHL